MLFGPPCAELRFWAYTFEARKKLWFWQPGNTDVSTHSHTHAFSIKVHRLTSVIACLEAQYRSCAGGKLTPTFDPSVRSYTASCPSEARPVMMPVSDAQEPYMCLHAQWSHMSIQAQGHVHKSCQKLNQALVCPSGVEIWVATVTCMWAFHSRLDCVSKYVVVRFLLQNRMVVFSNDVWK